MATSSHRKPGVRVTAVGNVAIVGFGSQGRAQAVRLRDAGYAVKVGLQPRSRSRRVAHRLGFATMVPDHAVRHCQSVAILAPDRVSARVLTGLAPSLEPGCLVVFAAGYPLHFGRASWPRHCDIVLVAPHGPGNQLEAGLPVSGFVGIHQDATGKALARARRYARHAGLAPLYETTPRDEALGDIFGEQALLCGGLVGLTSEVARRMVQRGIPAANAYFETVSQLRALATLLETRGLRGFWEEISDCAAAGMVDAAPKLFDKSFGQRLDALWADIESGAFSRRFQKRGRPDRMPAKWDILDTIAHAAKKKGGRRTAR